MPTNKSLENLPHINNLTVHLQNKTPSAKNKAFRPTFVKQFIKKKNFFLPEIVPKSNAKEEKKIYT